MFLEPIANLSLNLNIKLNRKILIIAVDVVFEAFHHSCCAYLAKWVIELQSKNAGVSSVMLHKCG